MLWLLRGSRGLKREVRYKSFQIMILPPFLMKPFLDNENAKTIIVKSTAFRVALVGETTSYIGPDQNLKSNSTDQIPHEYRFMINFRHSYCKLTDILFIYLFFFCWLFDVPINYSGNYETVDRPCLTPNGTILRVTHTMILVVEQLFAYP